MAKIVVGLFDSPVDVQWTLQDLRSAGFSQDQITLIANNQHGEYDQYLAVEGAKTAAEGAAVGTTSGTVTSGIGNVLAGLSTFVVPGIGQVVGLGMLRSGTTADARLGLAAGGLIGALTNAGIPQEDANVYNEGVRRGGTLVMVQADDADVYRAADIMNRHNVVDIDERGMQYRLSAGGRFDDTIAGSTSADTSDTSSVNINNSNIDLSVRESRPPGGIIIDPPDESHSQRSSSEEGW